MTCFTIHHQQQRAVRDNTMKWLVNLRRAPPPGDWCELITENKVLLCSEQRKKYGDVSVPFDEREKSRKKRPNYRRYIIRERSLDFRAKHCKLQLLRMLSPVNLYWKATMIVRIVVLIRNGIAHLCRWVGKESNIGQYWTISCTCGGWALGRVQCVYKVLGVARAKTSPVGG